MSYNLGHVVGPAGKGIQGISKTDTTGLVDTYTITYSDGTTSTFTVTNGESNADVVTEWESTPSNSKVPSEKLTKDSLDDKADSNHTHTGMLTTSDVKDNLTSVDTDKPLSAKQGKELKTAVDGKVTGTKVTSWSGTVSDSNIPSEKLVKDSLDDKQATLVSGTNIKTINNNSLLGSGNIDIQGGGGADVGTFTELQSLITSASSGDTIILEKDYKNTGSESQITIDKPLTIIGNGHVIDANKVSRIFKIPVEGNGSTMLDLIFVNGYSNNSTGGAIYCRGSNKFFNCIFNNNNNVENSGGAVSCSSSNLFFNCSFNNNSSENGGAIYCGNGTIFNCRFEGNTATADGDNVYNYDTNPLIIRNCYVSTGLYHAVNYDDVNSADIVDNLTTNDATKVLSAKQGKALADLIGQAIQYINQ